MQYRRFGTTDLMLSEVGFGSWAIGGNSFGAVSGKDALDALARAESHGCNFIDTAAVYGEAEARIGRFLHTRRSRWVVATKYSGQRAGMTATLEAQLSRLGLEAVDLYQIHWMPSRADDHLLDELATLRQAGKARYTAVSLYNEADIRRALADPRLDGFQVKINLLTPQPFVPMRQAIARSGKGVIARSALEEGFLTGKYDADATFPDPNDRRRKITEADRQAIVRRARAFQALCSEDTSPTLLAARYVLSFPEVSSLLMSTKNATQADTNFSVIPDGALEERLLASINRVQREQGAFKRAGILRRAVGKALRQLGLRR